jgi:hypothetical protein
VEFRAPLPPAPVDRSTTPSFDPELHEYFMNLRKAAYGPPEIRYGDYNRNKPPRVFFEKRRDERKRHKK